jgi:pSer/pThr/pTyr-binding forkhead associated (FHA) protein
MDVSLVLFKKNGEQKTFPLPSSVTVIGRRHNCDLCIPLMSVSKRHCQLNHDGGTLKIRDLGSRNGTILNGKPIDEAVVKAGDSIGIGPLAFVFQIDGKPKTVARPQQPVRSLPKQSAPAEDIADEQFASALELDEDLELDDDFEVGDSDLLLDDSELLEDED